MFTSIIVPLF